MITGANIRGLARESRGEYVRLRSEAASVLAQVAVPAVVFLAHALFFRLYIVDDAGIAFTYARNLAHGYGLVSQPGVPPVEGYSDFAWVALLSPLFSLNIFGPHVTPKLISVALVLITFFVLARALNSFYRLNSLLTAFALTLLALDSGFVVWTTSGLENPLYALLVAGLVYVLGRAAVSAEPHARDAVIAGLLAAIAGMTRPDGAVFAAAYPLASLVRARTLSQQAARKSYIYRLLLNVAAFAVPYGAFILFRLFYFGDLVPNTFRAKFSTAYGAVDSPAGRAVGLFYGMAAAAGPFLLLGVLAATALLITRRAFGRDLYALAVLTALGACIYVALPDDLMGNYRFATPFLVCFFPYLVLLGARLFAIWNTTPEWKAKIARYALGMVLVVFGTVGILTSRDYSTKAFAPFDEIAAQFGFRFNSYANRLGLTNASVLVPDVGGTLYYSKLRVYDLGMLTDKTIAATAVDDRPGFYNYIFDTARPTFINTHHRWALIASLDSDPRFRRDYVPIHEEVDPLLKEQVGVSLMSGDYVRKDAVAGKEQTLDTIRAEYPAP